MNIHKKAASVLISALLLGIVSLQSCNKEKVFENYLIKKSGRWNIESLGELVVDYAGGDSTIVNERSTGNGGYFEFIENDSFFFEIKTIFFFGTYGEWGVRVLDGNTFTYDSGKLPWRFFSQTMMYGEKISPSEMEVSARLLKGDPDDPDTAWNVKMQLKRERLP